jgi:heat shock protein HtpX
VLLKNKRGLGIGYFISSIIAQIVLGILASTIVMWFSRQREYRADAGAAQLAGRAKMVSALRSLQRSTKGVDLPEQLAGFGISGKTAGGFASLFRSHPPLEQRIAALEKGPVG